VALGSFNDKRVNGFAWCPRCHGAPYRALETPIGGLSEIWLEWVAGDVLNRATKSSVGKEYGRGVTLRARVQARVQVQLQMSRL
jgi:hypothetical protein